MKKKGLTVILTFLFVRLFSQSPLEAKVSLAVENLTLEEALYLLVERNEINLSFQPGILPMVNTGSKNFRNITLKTVLDELLAGTSVQYKVVGTQVVLVKKQEQPLLPKNYTVSGYVRDGDTGELMPGAAVFDEKAGIGAYTNEFGFYSLTSEEGTLHLQAHTLGYQYADSVFQHSTDRRLNFEIRQKMLAEVTVNAFSDSTILQNKTPGILQFNLDFANKFSGLGGESDLIRLAYTLPGVQTGADGVGGMAVRGGNIDQNLFLLDGVPVYNATHGIGLFSIYNASSSRSATLLKGSFPAQYGGRISSVWDVQTREGNNRKFTGEAEIGVTSGKITLEGPFSRGKGSWLVTGRRAIFDFFSIPISSRYRRKERVDGYLAYFFLDLNLKTNYAFSEKDKVFLSYYRGGDKFTDVYEQTKSYGDTLAFFADNEAISWGNDLASLRWNHQYSNKLFGNTTLTYSRYYYQSTDLVDLETIKNNQRLFRNVVLQKYDSGVEDVAVKTDFDYALYPKHSLRMGAQFTQHEFQPGVIFFDKASAIDSIIIDTLGQFNKFPLRSKEADAYVQDEWQVNKDVKINAGLRISTLLVHGKTWWMPQPRLIVRVFEDQPVGFHFSVCRVSQFLHLLSPTSIGLPKDLWVSATRRVPPQHSWQITSGITRRLNEQVEMSVEGYFKSLSNLLAFRGTLLDVVNADNWQDMVSLGKGRAWGAEFLLKKQSGKLGGWFSYSLSWADRQFDKEINRGERYPFRLDHRHFLNVQAVYRLNHRWDLSAGFAYGSGTAFTLLPQQYVFNQTGSFVPMGIDTIRGSVGGALNDKRLPPYHRLDLEAGYSFKVRKVSHHFRFGVYNAYARNNPLYISVRDEIEPDGRVKKQPVQVILLPIFPSLRYRIEFN